MDPMATASLHTAEPPLHRTVPSDTNLKKRLRRAQRAHDLRAYLMISPLFLFILGTFIIPLAVMLYTSVHDPVIEQNLPNTVSALRNWQPEKQRVPPASAFAALARDMQAADENETASQIATRLNFETGGLRSLFVRSVRMVGQTQDGSTDWKNRLIRFDSTWDTPQPWLVIKNLSHAYTPGYYLSALDLRYKGVNGIELQPASSRIYLDVFGRTAGLGLIVTICCLLLAYPVAYLLASVRPRTGNLLLILVLLPFWTSLLVRTTAWIVLLQHEGVVNKLLMSIGVISAPLDLIYNRFGVVVTMTHILLPFMILPLYSVMKSIPVSYTRAARSLGASPWLAFRRVYFPQSMPGISAGVLLVFILSIGYYITPALVGGAADQMISYFVADNLGRSLNWGLAAALGGLLLASVLALYAVYERYVGIANVKLG
ncbi:ABC transporter permease [Paraburkholderia fungorum]|jgi:putative spermidine/putrescine transport system permease protein|uniref:ABC transporter permease n=2 Tax=Paraburkholderia fungorum TaxID=134537 RepID=A0AAP5V0N1_9BURK|nr:ABC transporter permease [Paraburkholderia fungorum]